jgi:hemolysin D
MRAFLWFETAAELCGRYIDVCRAAWRTRHEQAFHWLREEAEFLPAALALQRTPVSPLPRATSAALIALLVFALLWAVFGKIDIVATASGKIVPDGRTKVIQSVETARVTAIRVTDGSRVKAGDTLLELDSVASSADRARLRDDFVESALAVSRAQALLASMDIGGAQHIDDFIGEDTALELKASVSRIAREQMFLDGEIAEFRAKLARLDAAIRQSEAELSTVGAAVSRLKATLEIARTREADLHELAERQYVSRHEFLERQQSRIEMDGELAAQQSRLGEIRAAVTSARRQREEYVTTTRRDTLDKLNAATQKTAELRQEFTKADARDRVMTLRAPVDGTVQQLAMHTIGGVAAAAQPLMVIVPADHAAQVEAFIENRDVGFVKPGQFAAVKIEAFPYTRYGTLPAEVVDVSRDAIEDEKRGLIYAVRLRLRQTTISVDGGQRTLSPGMAASVEVRTGRRRLIEYFLSPLLTRVDESLRER